MSENTELPVRLHVGRFGYIVDVEGLLGPDGKGDIAETLKKIVEALENGKVETVPVLDDHGNRMKLILNGGQIDALVLDLGEGPKPGEISP